MWITENDLVFYSHMRYQSVLYLFLTGDGINTNSMTLFYMGNIDKI